MLFDSAAGLEIFEKAVAMFLVSGLVFLGDDADLAGEAVASGVERGALLAFGGAGAGAFLCIFAVGIQLSITWHTDHPLHENSWRFYCEGRRAGRWVLVFVSGWQEWGYAVENKLTER